MADMGDYGLAVDLENAIRTIARSEVERMRPATRQAEVVSINTEKKTVEVVFVGETDVVTVPYTSKAPAEVGQYVSIGGTTHDRHVVDVIGTDATQSQLDALQEETLPAFGSLRSAGAQTFSGSEWRMIQYTVPELYRDVDVTTELSKIICLRPGTYRYMCTLRLNTTSANVLMVVRKTWANGSADSDVNSIDRTTLNISGGGGEGGSSATGSYGYLLFRSGYVELDVGDKLWAWTYGGGASYPNASSFDIFRIGPRLTPSV